MMSYSLFWDRKAARLSSSSVIDEKRERRFASNSCLSIQIGEDVYSQKQLTYFLKPFHRPGSE